MTNITGVCKWGSYMEEPLLLSKMSDMKEIKKAAPSLEVNGRLGHDVVQAHQTEVDKLNQQQAGA